MLHPGARSCFRAARLGCCRVGMIDDPAACFDFLCWAQLLTQGALCGRKSQRHFLWARAKVASRKSAVPPPRTRLELPGLPGSGKRQRTELRDARAPHTVASASQDLLVSRTHRLYTNLDSETEADSCLPNTALRKLAALQPYGCRNQSPFLIASGIHPDC